MPDDPAPPYETSITYQDLPIVGLDGTIRRGTKSNCFRIRVVHDDNIRVTYGDLVFQADSSAIRFQGCVPDLSTLRLENRCGNREYVLCVHDRRYLWPSGSISGLYNRRYRDNSIETRTKKTAGELADLALQAAGETPASTAELNNTYPACDWSNERPNRALDHVLSLIPGHVCRTKDDTYECRLTDVGDGIDPDLPAKNPDYLADVDSGPHTIKVLCNKTWIGCPLQLEAVGLDNDGQYRLLDDLSYKPYWGWEKEWPSLFSGVTPGARTGLAIETVFRCYRVKVPQSLPVSIGESHPYVRYLTDLDLDPMRCVFGQQEPVPAFVEGEYWGMGDHPYGVAGCPVTSNPFTIDNVNKIVTFEAPIFSIRNCIGPADLRLHTSFHLRDTDGGWIRQVYESDRDEGQGTWVLEVPHLWRTVATTYTDCHLVSTDDNKAQLDAEVNTYLELWVNHFNALRNKRHVAVAGIHPVSLSGKVAQLDYRIGRGLTPQTRIAVHHEPTR